jgi:ribosome biogenesis protein MAK21
MCLKYLDLLIRMAGKKNRRHTEASVIALKDLFLDDYLKDNKKLTSFYNKFNNVEDSEITQINNNKEQLISLYIEDFIHKKYFELIQIIEDIVINDTLNPIKKKFMGILLEMLVKRPEREEKILEVLINKLGDPDVDICNHSIKLLKSLQQSHPKMSLIILKNVENFIARNSSRASSIFYSLVFLTHMNVINEQNFLEYSLKFFFDLFNKYADKEKEETFLQGKNQKFSKFNKNNGENSFSNNKILSLIVKRINMLCKFSQEKKLKVKELIDERVETLFKLSHSKSLKLRIEVLKLIFSVVKAYSVGTSNPYNSRYYKSLYEILLNKDIATTKHLKDLLILIMESLSFDVDITRIGSFLKRLLQICHLAEPNFITCVLIIVSQIIRNKHKLWKVVEVSLNNLKEDTKTEGFDYMKRDPLYANGDSFPLTEIIPFTKHYHPTVVKFSEFIINNYNKEIISYEGDPLLDFSLVNFLDKFILKNPKVKAKKKMKKDKKDNEEEELRKFMEEGNEEEEEDLNIENKNELDFITRFKEIEKVKSDKIKKKKKKVVEEGDIDDFADKLMDDEYEKIEHGGDIDEDLDFVDEEDGGEDYNDYNDEDADELD